MAFGGCRFVVIALPLIRRAVGRLAAVERGGDAGGAAHGRHRSAGLLPGVANRSWGIMSCETQAHRLNNLQPQALRPGPNPGLLFFTNSAWPCARQSTVWSRLWCGLSVAPSVWWSPGPYRHDPTGPTYPATSARFLRSRLLWWASSPVCPSTAAGTRLRLGRHLSPCAPQRPSCLITQASCIEWLAEARGAALRS